MSSAGVRGAGTSESPSVTPDGRYAVFASTSTNLVDDDTNHTLPTTPRVTSSPGPGPCGPVTP